MSILPGEHYSTQVVYTAPGAMGTVEFHVDSVAYVGGPEPVARFLSVEGGPDNTLPYNGLLIYKLTPSDHVLREGETLRFQVHSITMATQVVRVPVDVVLKAADGVGVPSVTVQGGEVVFQPGLKVADGLLIAGDDSADMLLTEPEIILRVAFPLEDDHYVFSDRFPGLIPVGYLTDGVCDRVEPVRLALVSALDSDGGPDACLCVEASQVWTLTEYLDVSDVSGVDFDAESFAGLGRLFSVGVTASSNTTFGEATFSRMPSLSILNMHGVPEGALLAGTFAGAPELWELHVRGAMTSVPDRLFEGSPPLRYVFFYSTEDDSFDVPVTVERADDLVEGLTDEQDGYFIKVASGAPFTLVVGMDYFHENRGPQYWERTVRAGEVLSDLIVVANDSAAPDLKEVVAYTGPWYGGFEFRLPSYYEMMNSDPMDPGIVLPTASLSYEGLALENKVYRFRVTLSAAAAEKLSVRYQYGVDRTRDDVLSGRADTLRGNGDVDFPAGVTSVTFDVVKSKLEFLEPGFDYTLEVSLAEPMASEPYSLIEGSSAVSVLID